MAIASMDISSIRALVARARRRLRLQSALEGATTAVIIGSAAALVTVFLVRAYLVAPDTGVLMLAGSGGIVAAGGVIAAIRRQDDEDIARRIDRASNLSDRLSTAVAFDRLLAADPKQDADTVDLMRAAVKDAVKAAPKADLKRSTPFRLPRDTRAAALFACLAILAAGLGLPSRDTHIDRFDPERAGVGEPVSILGQWLCGPRADTHDSCVSGKTVVFSAEHKDTTVTPDVYENTEIDFTVPDLPPRPYMVSVMDGNHVIGTLRFEIVDRKAEKRNNPDAVTWDPDDRSYVKDLLEELQAQAKNDNSPELQAYVDHLRQLLQQADQGELSKEQLLDELQKAEDALHQGEEPDQQQVDKQLADTGKQLEQNELTKDLSKALQQGDMKKAQQEMEKLAQKLDKGDLSEKQQEELAKALENAAKQFEQQQQQQQQQDQQKIDQAQKDVDQAQKDFDKEQDPNKKQDAERRLDDKKRQLEQLQKDKDKKDKSSQRRELERLEKDLNDAAQSLKKNDPKNDKQQDKQNQGDKQNGDKQNGGKQNQGDDQKDGGQKQASQKMHDAAQEGGKIDDDKRKETTEKKVASQMDDLREAMRRAKRRGNKGGQSPFGKNGQQSSDFERRARGGQGEKGAWQKGQGKGQNGGSGDQKPDGPSDTWGTGHDDDLTSDPTAKNGNETDKGETGIQGKGPSRKETILSAAEKGFASKGYEKVYADYKQIVEEVMNSEKVPSSYKYYIKKYFTKIKPH